MKHRAGRRRRYRVGVRRAAEAMQRKSPGRGLGLAQTEARLANIISPHSKKVSIARDDVRRPASIPSPARRRCRRRQRAILEIPRLILMQTARRSTTASPPPAPRPPPSPPRAIASDARHNLWWPHKQQHSETAGAPEKPPISERARRLGSTRSERRGEQPRKKASRRGWWRWWRVCEGRILAFCAFVIARNNGIDQTVQER